MARPSIINDLFIVSFCSDFRSSCSIETAIQYAGIGRETYYGWARRVHQGGGSGPMRKLITAVDQMEGEVKLVRESKQNKLFDKDWKALASCLARKYPEEYGPRRRLEPDAPTQLRRPERIVWVEAPSPKPIKGES
jgi:hypothetical protein